MQDIHIPVRLDPKTGQITIRAPDAKYITQGDNNMQRLVFERPQEFEDFDLIVVFFTGKKVFEEQNLGTSNEFVITDALTQERTLSFKIYYYSDGERTLNSDNATLDIRQSQLSGCACTPTTPLPSPIRRLVSKGFATAEADGNDLVFKNLAGGEVARVALPAGGAGDVTKKYVDDLVDDEAETRQSADEALQEQIDQLSPIDRVISCGTF